MGQTKCCVLDSGFATLTGVLPSMTEQVNFPGDLSETMRVLVRRVIKKRAQFYIDEINPEEAAKYCQAPAMFIHCKNDKLYPKENSEILYKRYATSNKILKIRQGNHYADLTDEYVEMIVKFFKTHLLESPKNALKNKEPKEH